MKKSSFLHNSKDMLSKSFKPAKCKTTLKLAAARIKLMKNKKEVQVKQMKRELAQLLDSGQDQTARIRVEHVIREEKMMAAYELIELYCELIVARLPIIETQKNCPIDLKEAIASVIFASPRCGDIPELLDVKKHFTAKYGKEFTSAAIELRPDCGVSRMLVEKLSAKAPDGQTKIKVLTAIAEEHNIKWDAKSFGGDEALPPNEFLNGPNTFEKANRMHAEAPQFATPDVQAPPSHHMMPNQTLNSSEQNARSSLGTQNLGSRQNSGESNVVSSTSQSEMRPSEARSDMAEIRQLYHGEGNAFSLGHQGWNMEFKDATSAAQAAAESAERASMAARVAAELSSHGRITRQYSEESQKSVGHVVRDERTGKNSTSKFTESYLSKDSGNSSITDRQPRAVNDRMDSIKQYNDEGLSEISYQDAHDSAKRSAQTASLRSEVSSDSNPSVRSVQEANGYPQKSLSKEEEVRGQTSLQKQFGESEPQGVNQLPEGLNSEKFEYFEEERIRKHSSTISSSSHSSISSDDGKFPNSSHQMFRYDSGEDPSVDIHGQILGETSQQSSHDVAAVIFDESGSDGEDFGFDIGSKQKEETNIFLPSPSTSPRHLSTDTGTGSLFFKTSKLLEKSESQFSSERNFFPEFSQNLEASIDSSEPDKYAPVTFDDSDGPGSETETDTGHSWLHDTKDSRHLLGKEIQTSGSARSSITEMHGKNNQRIDTVGESRGNFGFGEEQASHSSPRLGKSKQESIDVGSETSFYHSVEQVNSLESSRSRFSSVHNVKDYVGSSHSDGIHMDDENSDQGKGLNFGNLTGGLRHRGYNPPPYKRSQLDNISSSAGENPTKILQSDASPAKESMYMTGKSKILGNATNSRMPSFHSDSDSDNSQEEFGKQTYSHGRETSLQNVDKDSKTKSNLRGADAYFYSGSSDSEDDSAKQVFTGRSNLGSGVSRRTKVTHSSSKSISHPKVHASSSVLVKSDSSVERNPTSSFYGAESPQSPQSQRRHSSRLEDSEQPSSAKVGSKPTLESKISLHGENWKLSGGVQPFSSKQKLEASESIETKKTSSAETPHPPMSGRRHSSQLEDFEQPRFAKVGSKPTLESKISLHEENRKLSGGAQQLSSKQKLEASEGIETKKTSRAETSQPPKSQRRHSSQLEDSKQPSSAKVGSKPMESKISLQEENRKSSGVEQPLSSKQKLEASESIETKKTSSGNSISREDSGKKANHVHPKLPDYDTIAAKLQALRMNRQ